MVFTMQALLLSALLSPVFCQSSTASSKRGLVYVPSKYHPSDDQIWVSGNSDLSWYYNYGASPSAAFNNATKLEFVPMIWGAPTDNTDTGFLDNVRSQIKGGANISYVLTFNEPDGSLDTGGSNIPADLAASTWIREIEPLREQGVKLGAPAVTGAPGGFTWLETFFNACNGSCHADFIPVHWYGDFGGLASHLGQVRGTYPNMTIWVTEYADSNAPLKDSQTFYNTSAEYFERLDYITHYSYFGAFRSDASNVGPNAAMLTQKGELTDIGSLYLGGSVTGKIPKAAKGAAGHTSVFAGYGVLVALASLWFFV